MLLIKFLFLHKQTRNMFNLSFFILYLDNIYVYSDPSKTISYKHVYKLNVKNARAILYSWRDYEPISTFCVCVCVCVCVRARACIILNILFLTTTNYRDTLADAFQ